VTGGVWHPDGCRCPGCRPPPAPAPRPPVPLPLPLPHPPAPRSSCRRPRSYRSAPGGGIIARYGIIGPAFVIILTVMITGFWPAMVWHGEGGPTGTAWQWDVRSTIGCCIWWGFLLLCGTGAVASRKLGGHYLNNGPAPGADVSPLPDPPMQDLPGPTMAPPSCQHPGAVPVNNILTGKLEAWLCPDCETQLDPGFRAAELKPDASWPPVRRSL
jgi:hypothetical protein